jgi:hypothetical protein
MQTQIEWHGGRIQPNQTSSKIQTYATKQGGTWAQCKLHGMREEPSQIKQVAKCTHVLRSRETHRPKIDRHEGIKNPAKSNK